MTVPYQPADGVQARWRYAYELVTSKKPGDEITLMELAECLGVQHFTDEDRTLLRRVMWEAKAHLERDKKQTVRTVPKFGWIVLTASGNLNEAEHRRKKAGRAVGRTARILSATERDQLSPIERQRYDAERRSVLAAERLFNRKPRDFIELVQQSRKELPGTS